MPIFTEDDDVKPPVVPNLVINPTEYQTQVVEYRKQNYDALATFYAGSKWACDYYSQVQGRDSAAASYNDDLPAAYGQYRLIRGFELVLSTPLSHSQNSSDVQGFNSTGAAIIYSIVTPQSGDVFIADIGNGRNVLLQIHNPQRVTIYEESAHTVEFKVTEWMTEALQAALNGRVVETVFFNRENFRNGVKNLLQKSDVDVMHRLSNAYRRLVNLYFRDFFDTTYSTFTMPEQGLVTYDPNLTRFAKRLFGTGDHRLAVEVVELGISGDVFYNQLSLFDAIQTRDAELMYSVCRKWGVSPIAMYRTHPLMASIYFSGVQQVVSPIDTKYTVDNEGYAPHVTDLIEEAGLSQTDLTSILPALTLDSQVQKPKEGHYIKPVTVDDFYVFSKAFYDDTPGKSQLELLMLNRLRGKSIDLNMLADVADNAVRWDNLERYYYIPILLTLIKLAPGVL